MFYLKEISQEEAVLNDYFIKGDCCFKILNKKILTSKKNKYKFGKLIEVNSKIIGMFKNYIFVS